MTLKTSFFNRGIYKSAIRRYIWGAVLYAILLFMCTSMPILFSIDPETYTMGVRDYERQLILTDIYLYLPLVISIFVPTVMALLAYRFVHAKKTSVFIHSLPVSRSANYISTVSASLTLMAVPVILNGAILSVLSACGYGELFDFTSCLIWTGLNLLSVFLLFSVSSFSAFLTGSSFALVGINLLLHLIGLIFAASFSALADSFLYGYFEANSLINAINEWNFVVYIMSMATRFDSILQNFPFDWLKLCIMLIIALALYAFALLLYRKRRLETAEDVAAYKVLNPIFKYLLTFLSALGTFGICCHELSDGVLYPVFLVLTVSAVSYFALEMILKKSFKIWRSYKGYIAFVLLFTALVSVFAFTDFFGYETRIPSPEKTEAVSISQNRRYDVSGYVANDEIKKYTAEVHRELTSAENIYTIYTYPNERTEYLYIQYKLKNGRVLSRRYPVTDKMLCEVMDPLYKSEEYKVNNLELFTEKIGEIHTVDLSHIDENLKTEEIPEFVECLKRDLLALDYTETRNHSAWDFGIWLYYSVTDELSKDMPDRSFSQCLQYINPSFTHTMSWLSEHGYIKKILDSQPNDLTVITDEQWQKFEEHNTTYEVGEHGEKVAVTELRLFENIPDAVRISNSDTKRRIWEYISSTPVRYVPDKEYSYYVCVINPFDNHVNIIAAFYEDADWLLQFIS